MAKRTLLTLILLCSLLPAVALDLHTDLRWHCATDSVRADSLLSKANALRRAPLPERIVTIIDALVGSPYTGHTLEGDEEKLAINMCEFDCVTFVQTVMAIERASHRPNPTWRDMAYELEKIRYRRGELGDYASRLHYTADWIADNRYRKNLEDITGSLPNPRTESKTLDYMTRHRDDYPALADSANFARLKDIEEGFRRHSMTYITKESVCKKEVASELQTGDIIVFQTRTPGLDASHVGFIIMENGLPYLVHASSAQGRVVHMDKPVSEYIKQNSRNCTGVRIIRITD